MLCWVNCCGLGTQRHYNKSKGARNMITQIIRQVVSRTKLLLVFSWMPNKWLHWKTASKLILNVHKLCQIFTADSSGTNFAVQVHSLFQINCLNVYLSCEIISHVSCQRVPRSSQVATNQRFITSCSGSLLMSFLVISPLSAISATVLVRISQKNVLRTKHPSYNKRINYPLN